MFCPDCGHENAAEARFCAACGSMMEETAIATAEPPVAPPYATVEYAGFWMRLAAAIIDAVIVFIGFGLVATASIAVSFGLFLEIYDTGVDRLSRLAAWAFPLLYYVLMTGLRGQTLGKMALRIKVVRADERVPGLGYAALRETVGKFVSAVAFFLGFLWVAWDPAKRGWHDYIAGTRVIKTRI